MMFNLKKDKSDNKSSKICFPRYECGEYETLAEAVQTLEEHNQTRLYLFAILQYNIRYRNYCREYGIDETVELMLREAPALRSNEEAINELYQKYKRIGQLASYDIQCYNIYDTFYVLGQPVNGLRQLMQSCEIYVNENLAPPPRIYYPSEESSTFFDCLHVGQIFKSYPKFDSDDGGRTYDTYIIRDHPISNSEMIKLYEVPSGTNAIRVHEHIPESMLPMVYYEGYGDYMLVATKH